MLREDDILWYLLTAIVETIGSKDKKHPLGSICHRLSCVMYCLL